MPVYKVKTTASRSFTQQLFLKSGGNAILRVSGTTGVVESDTNIPEKDLNFVLTVYNLTLEDYQVNSVEFVEDVVEEVITTTKKPVKKSTKVTTTVLDVQFTEDL